MQFTKSAINMKCQFCKTASATVRCTEIINGKKSEMFLCMECAEKQGLNNPLAGLPEIFTKILENILGEEIKEAQKGRKSEKPRRRCGACGATLAQFEKTGLLGCPECYTYFEDEIKVLLRRIHGSNQHIGNRPRSRRATAPVKKLPELQRELQQAVKDERFERAAELRNMIRDLESGAQPRRRASKSRKP